MRPLALLLSAWITAPVSAQPIACAFTLVCAPEIECETLEGIPLQIAFEAGRYSLMVDGAPREARPVDRFAPPGLALVFDAPDATLLFTLTPDNDGALTRHEIGPGGRLQTATFLGPCERA